MPLRDGTGPGARGTGQGRGRRGMGVGPGGNCICPACGTKIPHQAGTPCSSIKCSKCNGNMVRE
ncbi:MAG: hypothetical protein C4540_06585 [Candidatus Omnitrophota bacterium]|nr:MAG: hypothetical protein C4540_06585 [Candidatus Omnitrophota bacterium]